MLKLRNRMGKREAGFTLIELMIVVAIIGILAAIAVPNFINYRNKSRIAAGVGTGESIRAAFASFAADSDNNLFPGAFAGGYADMVSLVNKNGGTLKTTETSMGIKYISYTTIDTDGDATPDSYALVVSVIGVPDTFAGHGIKITPEGILRCPTAAACP